MLELIIKGGPVMWPLLACSIVALAVVFERLLFWLVVSVRKNQKLVNRIFTLTEKGEFDKKKLEKARKDLGIESGKPNPVGE